MPLRLLDPVLCRAGTHLCAAQGGLGGEPGNEAHGGYTYCGVAALALLGRLGALDVAAVAAAASQRQAWLEGGFSGRTNKLADGCYSFWQGALFPLLRACPPAAQRAPACAPPWGVAALAVVRCALTSAFQCCARTSAALSAARERVPVVRGRTNAC